MKVLIIEDDKSQSFLWKIILQEEKDIESEVWDNQFHIAMDPHAYIYNNIDIVVCDIHLGEGIDGKDILGNLKAERPEIKRIALTGWEDKTLYDLANIVLYKVVNPEQLIEALRG